MPENPVPNDRRASRESSEISADAAVQELLHELAALRKYIEHFAAATLDEISLRVNARAWSLAVKAAASIVGVTILIGLGICLVRGIAGGLAGAFGAVWLGNLATGVLGLVGLAIGNVLWTRHRHNRRRKLKAAEYEERKADQRQKLGRDVEQASKAAA